jgi:type II secretory pathway component GspD/PulD (secretin)
MLTVLAASWIAVGGSAPAQTGLIREATAEGRQAGQPIETRAIIGARAGDNGLLTTGAAEKGLILNLRGVPLDDALKHLSEAAGFTIIREANTETQGTVDIVSARPLKGEEIVSVLNKVLAPRGLTAIPDGQTLTIMTVEDAQRFNLTPVQVWNNEAASIPRDVRIVTEVIGLHSLSPTQAVKDLASLLPPDAGLVANEGGNSVIMSARQADIRRFAQIIQALDSAGGSELEVFALEHADAKALAQEVKDVFGAQDAGANPGNAFQNLLGNRGGAGTGNSKRAAIRVNAVSDDHNNAVLVSAPADIMPGISNLIHTLDVQQDDVVQIQVFSLRHADATNVASQIALLFPDPTAQAGRQNNGRGPGAQFVTGATSAASGAGLSERAKKQAAVIAVPDGRTQSVLVTASKATMAQIESIITEMDANDAGAMDVFVYHPIYGDVPDMQAALSDLVKSSTQATSTSSSLVNVLAQRANQAAQSSGTTATGTISTTAGSSGGRSSQQ